MTKQRHRIYPAVFVIVRNTEGHILLHRRNGTGYMDGFYDFPSGHVEPGEELPQAAARELMEEAGLAVDAAMLELVHINQNDATPEVPYYNFVFLARMFSGTPRICEPEKCDDMGFFALGSLPRITPQVRCVLDSLTPSQVTVPAFSRLVGSDFAALSTASA